MNEPKTFEEWCRIILFVSVVILVSGQLMVMLAGNSEAVQAFYDVILSKMMIASGLCFAVSALSWGAVALVKVRQDD